MLLGKTVFHIRQKGVPPLLLPASVLQLPRCLARICNFFHKNNPIAIWQILKLAIAAGKTDCKIQFASQTWAARPHLGSIFEKLLHRKTFSLPAALSLQPRLFYFDVVFHMKHFEIASRETTRIRFGKAGAHPQIALGIAIAP